MSKQARLIYSGAHYEACAVGASGICVTRKRKQGGILVIDGAAWIETTETAINDSERHDICRAVLAKS